MIFTERQITVHKGKSSINEPVILYRGDYEVSIKFTIMESKFRFKSGVNLVDSEKASHGQLAILAPYGGNVFSEVVKCEDGTVTFTLTKEMIDQLEEVGLYSFQIRLFDYYRESRVSIPPVEFGIEVREPVASEDHDNSVNNAIVGYSIAKVVDPSKEDVGDTFDAKGNYNKTDWETGDRISEGKLNKIEDALDKINQNEINDKNALNKQMISNFNVLQNQIDHKASEVDLEVERKRIDLLIKVENNQTEGNAELLDIRIGADGKTYDTAGDAIRCQFSKNNDNISSINASMTMFNELDVIIEDGFRDASSGEFNKHSGFKCIYMDCEEGEEYMCNTHVSTSSVAVVNFYVNGSLYSYLDKGAIGIHENYKFTVPEGITQLSITSKSDYTPSIKKIGLIDVVELKEEVNSILAAKEIKECCYRTEDTFQYIFKYNNNYDAMIRIFKHGPNKLPQLATSVKRENANNSIELSKSGFSTEFFKITTDIISPYRGLNAKNNADGDSDNLDVWVGGYHGYNGSVNASVPAAKNISFDVFVDNRKIDGENTDLIEINKNAKVVVVNQIQGCNTMKNDGTGRCILEEKVTYTFSELGKIDVSVEFKALEDLSINYYYGLMNTLSTYNDFLLFENDNINKTPLINYDFSTNVNSGDKLNSDCISFLAKKGNDCMITRLNNEYGLGKLRFNDNTMVCHFTTAKKLYFNLITSKFDMVENQVVSWEGNYKFYSEV